MDGVVFHAIGRDVMLGHDVAADHAPCFTDVELPRPVTVVRPLVFAQAVAGHVLTHVLRHAWVGLEEPEQAVRVVAVLLVDLFAFNWVGVGPRRLGAGDAHRHDRELPVVALDLAAGHAIAAEDLTDALEQARLDASGQQFVLFAVVWVGLGDLDAVVFTRRQIQADVVRRGV